MLRVAWASQYEWKEDKVANATFDFEWTRHTKTRRNEEFKNDLQGTVVIADGKIQRIHLTKGDRRHLGEARGEIGWVMRRFIRTSFDEIFKKDAKFVAPEKLADGNTLIVVGGWHLLVRDDRIVGSERMVGPPKKRRRVRIDYKLGEMGEGYAVLGENSSHTQDGVKTTESKMLVVAKQGVIPIPAKYSHDIKDKQGTRKTTMLFSGVRFNVKDPIVIDPAARDRVKAAWESRYTWPTGIRYEGNWSRDLDKAADKGGWRDGARGEFQLFAGELEVRIDDRLRWNPRRADPVVKSVTGELNWAFNLMRVRPFEEAFQGCGFESAPDDPAVVRLIGHASLLAVRIENGSLIGHMTEEFGAQGWWVYKLKKVRDGRTYIERMTRKIRKRKQVMKFTFTTKKGVVIYKSFERIVKANPFGRGNDDEVGVLKFKLTKLLVDVKE